MAAPTTRTASRWNAGKLFRLLLVATIGLLGWKLLLRSQHPEQFGTPLDELSVAINSDNIARVQQLLNQRPDLNGTLKSGQKIWDEINLPPSFRGNDAPRIMQMLLEHKADPNARTTDGTPILVHFNSDPRVVKLLLDHGAKADARDPRGNNALNDCENEEAMRLLVMAGADVNAQGIETYAVAGGAATSATSANNASPGSIVPKVKKRKAGGYTALMAAAAMQGSRSPATGQLLDNRRYPSATLYALLLDKGAHLENIEGYRERTAFLIAAERQNAENVAYLIKRGANVHAVDNEGRTALDYALKNADLSVFDLLFSKSVKYRRNPARDRNFLLSFADYPIDLKRGALYLRCGIDINLSNDKGETALLRTAIMRNESLIKQVRDNRYSRTDTRTRIARAVKQFTRSSTIYEKAAEFLLDHGADPNKANNDGLTPLMAAVSNNNVPMVKALLAHGAKPNLKSRPGMTPFDIARAYGFTEVEQLLKK